MRPSLRWLCLAAAYAGIAQGGVAQAAEPLAVDVVNASTPTLCAETDNVYLKLTSPQVRGFTIEATHPAYAGTIVVDRTASDLRNCDMGADPSFPATPRRVTLYESGEMQLVGHTYPGFWRPAAVPVRVGDRVETGLHLLQLYVRYKERTEEVLVLYPADGYWRARPLPPPPLPYVAYGSSFMVGPVETEGRPFVDITEIVFDPAARAFHLAFARGGGATLRLAAVDEEHATLDVAFDTAPGDARPFAALRSMFVTETNADVAQLAWRSPGGTAYEVAPVMTFGRATALELWAGPPPALAPQHERARHDIPRFPRDAIEPRSPPHSATQGSSAVRGKPGDPQGVPHLFAVGRREGPHFVIGVGLADCESRPHLQ